MEQDVFPEENLVAYLNSLHLDEVEHAMGSFKTHLLGTACLLKEWTNDDSLSKAGLFHSIYGTEDFHRQTLQHSDREQLRELIGEEAEKLAFLFSTCRRRSFFANLSKIHSDEYFTVRSMIGDHVVEVSREELVKLLELEVANLLDQAPNPEHLPDITRATFLGIAKSLENVVSKGANQAMQNYLLAASK